MITLTELLSSRGFKSFERTKIIRHLDQAIDVKMLRRRGHFEFYQRTQIKDVFNCERIVSFIGEENRRGVFCGIYSVDERRQLDDGGALEIPPGYPHLESLKGVRFVYALSKVPGFEDLEDRLVIDWGDAPLAWHQWFQDREVVEILPAGYVMDWPGYQNVLLPLPDLKAIFANPHANREWHRRLSSVAGVYCILHARSGQLYIGSAYGKDGIWGRWRCYAETNHGGNVLLREKCDNVSGYSDDLVFSILQTLPSSSTKEEAISVESGLKAKLGARAFGLNLN